MTMDNLGGQLAMDVQGLQRLKHTASVSPEKGLKEAARQFEAIFVQMMLKSMREAIPESGMFDSKESRFYTEMLDKQWSQHISEQGVGLADQLIRQLEGRGLVAKPSSISENLIAGIPHGTPRVLKNALADDAAPQTTADTPASHLADELDLQAANSVPVDTAARAQETANNDKKPEHAHFLSTLTGPAEAAAHTTGVPAKLILAQAALETGWGKHEIPTRDGGNSHNLFGIKAGSHWRGETTDITTTEYVDGRAVKQVERFRVYDSFEEAFTDYARLIGDNPRYAGVVTAPDANAAARALQAGGYATDPGYADKLIAMMDSIAVDDPFSLAQSPTHIF